MNELFRPNDVQLAFQPDESKKFLNLLDPRANAFTFCVLRERDREYGATLNGFDLVKGLFGLHGTLDEHFEYLVQANTLKLGIYVVVNATDGSGRKKKRNIQRIRAIWNEDDSGEEAGIIFPSYQSITVETSPGKRHYYWLIEGEWPCDEQGKKDFDGIIATMVRDYGSDPDAVGINRVLRLPGFFHMKAEPHLVKIIDETPDRYTRAALLSAFPIPEQQIQVQAIERTIIATGEEWKKQKERLRSALKCVPAEDRNKWYKYGAAIYDASQGSNEGFNVWDTWCRSTKAGNYNRGEQRRYWATQFDTEPVNRATLASIFKEALENGWIDEYEMSLPKALDVPEISLTAVIDNDKISNAAMEGVKATSKEFSHNPTRQQYDGLRQIAKVIEAMACRDKVKSVDQVYPSFGKSFYLSSLPAGMGKTTTLIESVKAIIRLKEHNHVGIIIFLFRREEIKTLTKRMGLASDDFAVIVSEEYEENKLGRQDDKTLARVLFTTQKRLEKRSGGGKRFAEMKEFFFNGKPRQVRVWDEALLPALPLTLEKFAMRRLQQPFKDAGYIKLSERLEEFGTILGGLDDNSLVAVPCLEGIDADEAKAWVDGADKDRMQTLFSLAGQTVRVRREMPAGSTLLSYEDFLPQDLAPMLILDASGQYRKTYEFWAKHRGNLQFLFSPQKRYDGLTIHHWNLGSGRTAQKHGAMPTLVDGIAKTINDEIPNDEKVLIIHFKSTQPKRKRSNIPSQGKYIADAEAEIKRQIVHNPDRIRFCNWGRHTATNDYCHIKHVFLTGVQQYNVSNYEATLRLSKGLRADETFNDEDYEAIRIGEIANNILQAANRGMIRNSDGDGCPPGCHLYAIFSTNADKGIPRALLDQRLFPGATVDDWLPIIKLSSNKLKVASYLLVQATRGRTAVPRSEFDIKDPSYLKRILENDLVRKWLKQAGIAIEIDRLEVKIRKQPIPSKSQ